MEEQIKENLGFHYTPIEAFMKMLDGIGNGKFKFHASSIFSLNDPSEMKYGYGEIMKKLPHIEAEFSISNANYKLSEMWNKDKSYSYEEWYKIHLNKMKEYSQYPYVISYSRNRDNLQLWGMYGDNGRGIALGFDLRIYFFERLSQKGLRILDSTHLDFENIHSIDVEYGSMSMKSKLYFLVRGEYIKYLKEVQGITDKEEIVQKQLNALSRIMILVAPFVKHEAYEFEKESRIIQVHKNIEDIKFKPNVRGGLTPYIEVEIPTSYLKEVIIGPCCDFDLIKKCIEIRLLQKGIGDVEIAPSAVPYRG